MPQVSANPEEMRRFAKALDEIAEVLRQKRMKTSRSFENLHHTWRDAKYAQFEKTFSSTLQDLDGFLKSAQKYSEFLRTKAAKLDRYMKR